ncbi:bifunctional folylpolyglutamate synthase/dihydrofolate synthase [Kribbella sandramycini]|uniref:Dihydrofolate synthase/folylpolyglutamate synthase n=1 Tax=Kribbella sandramycini TaxID=60450 RepID=A0A7Y4NZ03_9ACTN|nr:folylpolyglutamate synthase/dihydrofolate synthase family protein [Kribbella sandramycini]MBB6567936.1 dihydrofolate synthase/folylpolyglutamate synthase [Kribbella sandramycini]NOL39469.1 bifunctional folylpolyglutamate synthase/dihydrofolate synthase [Kribbella sandramycini]
MSDLSYAEVSARLQARWPEQKMDPTLERVQRLVELLGDPQKAYPVVHLTGTNGKTSTARMIDQLLQEAGLRTGRFTSPHLETVRERITLNGEPISEERFVETYAELEPYLEVVDAEQEHPLSFFEVVTAMAYAAFADAPVDVAVIEVGLGGAWDATNVADGTVSVITPVAVDHAHILGADPVTIASEKSGIVKPGGTTVTSQQSLDVLEVLMAKAAEVGAPIVREGLEFGVVSRSVAVGGQLISLKGLGGEYDDVFLPLHGEYQAHNAATAVAAVEALFGAGEETAGRVTTDLLQAGFAEVTSPGRMEVVRTSPTIIVDAAHNPHGAQATAETVSEAFAFQPLIGVLGCMKDKDVYGLLEAYEPIMETVVCTRNSFLERSMPAEELGELAAEVFGEERVLVRPHLIDAIDDAIRLAEENAIAMGSGGVLITGSVVTAGEARALLVRKPKDAE